MNNDIICEAKIRNSKSGERCKEVAMQNGRCRLHGGLSTGPKTPEGLANSKKANYKHGMYSREAIAERKAFYVEVRAIMARVDQVLSS